MIEKYPNLMEPAVQTCPYGLYARLRKEAPVYKMPETGFYLVTSYALCDEVIRQPDLFPSGVSPMALQPDGVPQEVVDIYTNDGWLPKASCSTSDPPRHTWVRAILSKLFTASKVRGMKPYIEKTAHELIDGFEDDGACEFIKAFAHPLPMVIIANQIGVEKKDLETFKDWSDAIVEPFSMMIGREREIECARLVVEMQHFFKTQIELRRKNPADDLLTIIANAKDEAGDNIEMDEMLSIVTIDLLASGNETTTAALASGMLKLVENEDILSALQNDPSLIANFAEEVLRLESPAQGMFRRVARDTVLGGVELKENEILSLRFGAANRDEDKYDRADRIDLHRKPPGGHLAFGIGRHHCVGAPLARQELISSFEILLSRLDNFRRQDATRELDYVPSFFGRHLVDLPVTFTKRG